jgi:hypothetical protein
VSWVFRTTQKNSWAKVEMAMGNEIVDRNCGVEACGDSGIAVLGEQPLCLDHFLTRCYEQLGEVDPRGRNVPRGALQLATQMASVEECSTQALRISLNAQELSNLERGRLLDVLLWAGELYVLLRRPGVTFRVPEAWKSRPTTVAQASPAQQ